MGTRQEDKKAVKQDKPQKDIEDLLKNRGFDSHKIISESGNGLLVAYGHKNHRHSELIKHDLRSRIASTVIVDGQVAFDDFVIRAKKYISIDA